ncbi:hypothetical protein FRC08_006125 [Ceratobasidium sp. 394]|nr:hypothetical protein FRC08_006125 [Ceratobasidium sp. 394]
MLVIDSTSSHCDVCLEVYSQASPPHVLPCGHVFCQSCVENVHTSQGAISHEGVDWAAAAHDPHFSVNDLPRLAPCPLCRSPFARNNTCRLQATYSTNISQTTESEGTVFHSEWGLTSDEDSTGFTERSGDSNSDISTGAAIGINLGTQISDIIFEGLGSASHDDIAALNHQVQEWLADEALEGRVEEHVLLRASIQLLMQSLRLR